MAAKTVLVFLMEGFEEIETVSPIDILRRGDLNVSGCKREDDDAMQARCSSTRGA